MTWRVHESDFDIKRVYDKSCDAWLESSGPNRDFRGIPAWC